MGYLKDYNLQCPYQIFSRCDRSYMCLRLYKTSALSAFELTRNQFSELRQQKMLHCFPESLFSQLNPSLASQ